MLFPAAVDVALIERTALAPAPNFDQVAGGVAMKECVVWVLRVERLQIGQGRAVVPLEDAVNLR